MDKHEEYKISEKLEQLNTIIGKIASHITALSVYTNMEKRMSETCEKHEDCMEKIYNTINEIKMAQARQEGIITSFNKSVSEFLENSRKDIYSPGGVIEKIGNHGQQLLLQWGFLGAVVVAVVIQFITKK